MIGALLVLVLFFAISAFLDETGEVIFYSTIFMIVSVLCKIVHFFYMAARHTCKGDSCSEENHATWKLLSSIGVLNPEVNPLKSLDFIIKFNPGESNNFCAVDYSQDYMNLNSGLWQTCVSDISIFYDSKTIPDNCQGGVLAITTNLVVRLNKRNFSEQVILDKFFFQKLLPLPPEHIEVSDIEHKKNDHKTWFTINSSQKVIKVFVDSYLGAPSTFCSGQICITLLFRKLK